MKRWIGLLLAAIMVLGLMAGCGKGGRPAPGQADSEILTYTRIDPDKTLLTVSRTGNIYIEEFSEVFMEMNPDVQVVCLDITGGNSTSQPVQDWITKGEAPDIMYSAGAFCSAELAKDYFEDLSASPLISNYESEALSRAAIDGRIYWLPGPSQIDSMVYNKTLFTQYGWEAPKTFDEFIALCLRIREDTDGAVQPWNPNAKYSDELKKALLGFAYAEVLGGLENRSWYEEFCLGNASFKGHMEPFYNMIQTLVDNGLLVEEHFTYSATTRGKEFAAGQIAMCNLAVANLDNDAYEYDFITFPPTTGEEGFICSNFRFLIGIPKKEHSEKERDAIDRYMAFFSSVEGQRIFIGDQLMISNVRDVPLSHAEKLAPLVSAIEKGHVFTLLDFYGKDSPAAFSFTDQVLEMLKGEMTAAGCIAAVDAQPFATEGKIKPEEPVAAVTEEFTILETSQYIADMYREAAGADIGLINNNDAFRGNLNKLFVGPLTPSYINAIKPRSFANDTALVKVSMSGAQLMDALNHPYGNDATTNSIYAFSGLKCKVAPWNPLGEKYLSVTLADGKAIEPDTLYTVAIWEGTVADEYITEVLERFEGSWEELMTAKLAAEGSIQPVNDGRISLEWD